MQQQINSIKESPTPEHVLAMALRIGAYLSFVIVLAAALFYAAGAVVWAAPMARVGVIVLLATPAVRIIAAVIMFALEKDTKMTAIAAGVLLILAAAVWGGLKLG